MVERVNRRRYDGSRRAAAAAQTKADIVAAARDMFLAAGYERTTLRSVAEAAGTSVASVKAIFANKSGLVRAVRDVALAGDTEPVPLEMRDWYVAILDERDPDVKLRAHAESIAAIHARVGEIHRLVREAAGSDEDMAKLWRLEHHQRRHGMEPVVQSMAAQGTLRRGLDVDAATTTLWVLSSPETYWLLTDVAGWSLDAYTAWLHLGMVAAVSDTPTPAHRLRRNPAGRRAT